MNAVEQYNFDRMGYIHIPGFLPQHQVAALLKAAKALEADAVATRPTAPRFRAIWDIEIFESTRYGYFFSGNKAPKNTLIIDDFWLYPDAFDFLIGHEPTLAYVHKIVQEEFTINNSELRIRYKGNSTFMHMGFPHGHGSKYSYKVMDGKIHCNMVRMVYFLHDVNVNQGPICFVPGSHRGEFPCPNPKARVEEEAGVVAIPVSAGDAILFTEACRHGGFDNRSSQTRYTLHVGYGPAHLRSQNYSTIDEDQNITPELLSRITPRQAKLLVRRRRVPLPGRNKKAQA